MGDRRDEAENPINEEVPSPTPSNDFLFLAGRFWGRDEVARTGFVGVFLKFLSYGYIGLSFLLILYGYQNTRPFTVGTSLLAGGGFLWAVNIYTARSKRRDRDREILEELGITVKREEKPVNWLSWCRIRLGWEAPPAVMTLSRSDIPFLSIHQGRAGSVPTVRLLEVNALTEQEQPLSLASPDVGPPVETGHLAPSSVDGSITDRRSP